MTKIKTPRTRKNKAPVAVEQAPTVGTALVVIEKTIPTSSAPETVAPAIADMKKYLVPYWQWAYSQLPSDRTYVRYEDVACLARAAWQQGKLQGKTLKIVLNRVADALFIGTCSALFVEYASHVPGLVCQHAIDTDVVDTDIDKRNVWTPSMPSSQQTGGAYRRS